MRARCDPGPLGRGATPDFPLDMDSAFARRRLRRQRDPGSLSCKRVRGRVQGLAPGASPCAIIPQAAARHGRCSGPGHDATHRCGARPRRHLAGREPRLGGDIGRARLSRGAACRSLARGPLSTRGSRDDGRCDSLAVMRGFWSARSWSPIPPRTTYSPGNAGLPKLLSRAPRRFPRMPIRSAPCDEPRFRWRDARGAVAASPLPRRDRATTASGRECSATPDRCAPRAAQHPICCGPNRRPRSDRRLRADPNRYELC
jgi:hypothetical protein